MNRNHMLKRKMTAGLAVGMAVAVGSVPMAMAANTANTKDSSSSVSKEETVYVNADASGNPQQITVSNWLKNAGSESSVEDQSDLTNIKNVKGDETFSENGDSLTWNTDGSDIYYQGQSNKDLPVSVKFTYFLDGQEMQPQDLVGKSGHLQIKIQYTNNEKKSAKVDGKNETIYSPFVMLTAMILPDDTFSNVTIDNGKVISDGSRNIVVGVGMPGLKDSLKLDTLSLSTDDEDKNSEDKTLDIDIPDSVSIEADVTDFSMSSSLTVALSDLLKDIDFDKQDIHIHVPEGAVKKDGPSAGVTLTTAIYSAFTQKPVRDDVAMTGEVTLTGNVLPIGGLKEKSISAHRSGIHTIMRKILMIYQIL